MCSSSNPTFPFPWRYLTGEKVEFATDIMSTTVTYWRPKVESSVKRTEVRNETNLKTTPGKQVKRGADLLHKIIRYMKATPTTNKKWC